MWDILTNFTFDRPLALALALIPALLNLGVIYYVLYRLPNIITSRTFGFFALSLFIWQCGDCIHRLSASRDTSYYWDCIFSVGWIGFAPLGLLFVLQYTGLKKLSSELWLLFLLFVPALFFTSVYPIDTLSVRYEYSPFWGWYSSNNETIITQLMIIWIAVLMLVAFILLVRFTWKSRHIPVLSSQSFLITVGLGFPLLIGLFTQGIFPILMNYPAIPVTSSFLSIFSISTVFALKRYRLFNLHEGINKDELIENLPIIVLTVSVAGRVTYANTYASQALNIQPQLGIVSIYDILPDESGNRQVFEEILAKCLEGSTVANKELLFYHNAASIPVLIAARPVYSRKEIEGILLAGRDITEIKLAKEMLLARNKELQRSYDELEQFTYVASHDMKEPLRMVSNYTQLLARRYAGELDAEAQEFIGYAVEGVHRMQQLIKDLLTYSQIGTVMLVPVPVNIKDVISRLKEELNNKLATSHATIVYEDLPEVWGIRHYISSLFQNLIENSIKFRSEKDPVIQIRADREADLWHFQVIDNGLGISEQYQEKVFSLFHRLHGSAYHGSGIGLSICKKIVELHEGQIWYTAAPGGGTVFHFTLPANKWTMKVLRSDVVSD